MRVYPAAPKTRNTAFRAAAAAAIIGRQKKLCRLPHIFSKVLELPFRSDADVDVHEDRGAFRFVAAADGFIDDVRAHAIEIHPGVMKVVIRDGGGDLVEEFELDRWRFRLPPSTRPALATAEYVDGELIVTVPKGSGMEEGGGGGDGGGKGGILEGGSGGGGFRGSGIGRLVAVQ